MQCRYQKRLNLQHILCLALRNLDLQKAEERMKKLNLAIIAVLTACSSIAQDLAPWKLNFSNGTIYLVNMNMVQTIDQEVMGQSMNIKNNLLIKSELTFKKNNNQAYDVRYANKAMMVDMDMMGKNVSYNSEKEEDRNSGIGEKLNGMVGAVTEANIDEKGAVTITKAGLTEEQAGASVMGPGASDSLMIANFYLKSPDRTIKPGESWTEKSQNNAGNIETTYSFVKIENGLAHISFEQVITTEQDVKSNDIDVHTKMQIAGKGQLKMEVASGLVTERIFDGKLTGQSTAMGMEIPQEGTQKLTTTIQKG
jgi:hypothetical protein